MIFVERVIGEDVAEIGVVVDGEFGGGDKVADTTKALELIPEGEEVVEGEDGVEDVEGV